MKKTLFILANALNNDGICWGIGGSLLLNKYGLVDQVNDIDIIVSQSDIDRAVNILDRIAMRIPAPIKEEYGTKYFYHYLLNEIDIDVMSRFIIKHDSGSYEFPFDEGSITCITKIENIELPYMSLEEWLIAYMLMPHREQKVSSIWNYLKKNGILYPDLLEKAFVQQLPQNIERKLKELLNKSGE